MMSTKAKINKGKLVPAPARKEAVNYSSIALEIQSGLASLREDEVCTDFEVIVGDKSFHCHKAVLASVSDYFRAMFTSGMTETVNNQTTIDNISPGAFKVILDLLYYKESEPDPFSDRGDDELSDFLRVTDMFQMTTLSKLCLEYLSNTMTAANCIQRWKAGKGSLCENLQKMSWEYLIKHFENVASESVMLTLDYAEFLTIIKNEYLEVSNEFSVWQVISDWIDFDLPNRVEKMTELIKHVCLTEIDHQILTEEIVFDEKIHSNLAVMKLVQNAVKFKNHPGNHTNMDLKFRECSGKEQVFMMLGVQDESSDDQPVMICYSARKNKWGRMVAHELQATNEYACCVHGQDIYVSGGTGSHGDTMHKYSTVNEAWTKCGGKMNIQLSRHAMVATDSCLYVVGGRKPTNKYLRSVTSGEVLQYCLRSEKWDLHGEILAPVEHASAVCLNNKIYIIGGVLNVEDPIRHVADSVQMYDTSTKTSSILCHLPSPCSFSCAAVRHDQIIVMTSNGEIIRLSIKKLEPVLEAIIPDFKERKGFGMGVKGDTLAVYWGTSDNDDTGQTSNVTFVNLATTKIWKGTPFKQCTWYGSFNVVIG